MNGTGGWRHECKYEIDYARQCYLQQRLKHIMQMDPHARADGRYLVRSIYFDNLEDKALREKRNGTLKREKFRIRYYNDDFSCIRLEKKRKHGQMCRKEGAALTEEECRKLLSGDTQWMRTHASPVVLELYAKMKYERLKPRVVVSYLRTAYRYPAGNVRVTLDCAIRTSLYHAPLLETDVVDISALEAEGAAIMELKYDAFLPELIAGLVQMEGIYRQSFSKYGASRRFG